MAAYNPISSSPQQKPKATADGIFDLFAPLASLWNRRLFPSTPRDSKQRDSCVPCSVEESGDPLYTRLDDVAFLASELAAFLSAVEMGRSVESLIAPTLALLKGCYDAELCRVEPPEEHRLGDFDAWGDPLFDADFCRAVLLSLIYAHEDGDLADSLKEAATTAVAAARFCLQSGELQMKYFHSFSAALKDRKFVQQRATALAVQAGHELNSKDFTESLEDDRVIDALYDCTIAHLSQGVLSPLGFPASPLGLNALFGAFRSCGYNNRFVPVVTRIWHASHDLVPLLLPLLPAGLEDDDDNTFIIAFSSLGSGVVRPEWKGTFRDVKQAFVAHAMDSACSWFCTDPHFGKWDNGAAWENELQQAIRQFSRHFAKVSFVGDSMGGTAALRFSRLATGKVVVFTPQVDLGDCPSYVRPDFTRENQAMLREELLQACRETSADIIVHVGRDSYDVDQVAKLPSKVRVVHHPVDSHLVSKKLKEEGTLKTTVLSDILHKEPQTRSSGVMPLRQPRCHEDLSHAMVGNHREADVKDTSSTSPVGVDQRLQPSARKMETETIQKAPPILQPTMEPTSVQRATVETSSTTLDSGSSLSEAKPSPSLPKQKGLAAKIVDKMEVVTVGSAVRIMDDPMEMAKLCIKHGHRSWGTTVHHMNGQVYIVQEVVKPDIVKVFDATYAANGLQDGMISVPVQCVTPVEAPANDKASVGAEATPQSKKWVPALHLPSKEVTDMESEKPKSEALATAGAIAAAKTTPKANNVVPALLLRSKEATEVESEKAPATADAIAAAEATQTAKNLVPALRLPSKEAAEVESEKALPAASNGSSGGDLARMPLERSSDPMATNCSTPTSSSDNFGNASWCLETWDANLVANSVRQHGLCHVKTPLLTYSRICTLRKATWERISEVASAIRNRHEPGGIDIDFQEVVERDGARWDMRHRMDEPPFEELLKSPPWADAVSELLGPSHHLLFSGVVVAYGGPGSQRIISDLTPLRPRCVSGAPAAEAWITVGAAKHLRTHGRFYHEVHLGEGLCEGDPQIGWLTTGFKQGDMDGKGVGDDAYGWAADGVRQQVWHKGPSPCPAWPRAWCQNDVIGCAVDIDVGRMEFSLNGSWVPGAEIRFDLGGSSIYPAVSARGLFTMFLTKASWKFEPPSGYKAWAQCGSFERPRFEAQPQKWHRDGEPLWPHSSVGGPLPPHCVNVFVPLVDVNAGNGATEFLPGSHLSDVDAQGDLASRVQPSVFAGAPVVFDYRTCHRGGANFGEDRAVLYFTYAAQWFQDPKNHRTKRLLFAEHEFGSVADTFLLETAT